MTVVLFNHINTPHFFILSITFWQCLSTGLLISRCVSPSVQKCGLAEPLRQEAKQINRLHIMIVLYTCPQNGTKTWMVPGYPHMYLWRPCLNHKYQVKMFCLHDPSHIQNVIIRILSKYLSNRLSIRFLNRTSGLQGGCRRTWGRGDTACSFTKCHNWTEQCLESRCYILTLEAYKMKHLATQSAFTNTVERMGRSEELNEFEHDALTWCHHQKESVCEISSLGDLPHVAISAIIATCFGTKRSSAAKLEWRPEVHGA